MASSSASNPLTCDILVFGATGDYGRALVEYITTKYGKHTKTHTHGHRAAHIKLGLAARNQRKLRDLREDLSTIDESCQEYPLFTVDCTHQQEVDDAVKNAKIVLNVVAPFSTLSRPIVDACVRFSVHYLDLSGEPGWYKTLVDHYHSLAQSNGVYIVPSCALISMPADLGVLMAERTMTERANREVNDIIIIDYPPRRLFERPSSGTMKSFKHIFATRQVTTAMKDFFYLNNTADHPQKATFADVDQLGIGYNRETGLWTLPSLQAVMNTRVVRRSLALRQQTYHVNECTGVRHFIVAIIGWFTIFTMFVLLYFSLTRNLLTLFIPTRKPRDQLADVTQQRYNSLVIAHSKPPGPESSTSSSSFSRQAFVSIWSNHSAHYVTVHCAAEAAVCLVLDKEQLGAFSTLEGGVLTPSTCMGGLLVDRLRRSGVHFDVRMDEIPPSAQFVSSASSSSFPATAAST